jgi:hypothetical protein
LVVVALTGTDRALALDFHIDRDALAQAQALDGKYLLGTNAFHLSAHEALAHFKAQDSVEKSNATLKGSTLNLLTDGRVEVRLKNYAPGVLGISAVCTRLERLNHTTFVPH